MKDARRPAARGRRRGSWALGALWALDILLIVLPILYMVLISFARKGSGYQIEWAFSLDNYKNILNPIYLATFRNSLELGLSSTLFIALVGYPFGYLLSFLSARWKRWSLVLLFLPFWIGGLVRLGGWITILQANGPLNSLLMALGLVREPVKFLYNKPAVVFGMVYALLPFMVVSVYSSAQKIDRSLIEASRDLGASRTRTFWSVCFPLTLPGLMGGIVLSFIPSMGLFFISDLLGGNKIPLVGNLIQNEMSRSSNWPFAAAIAVALTILTALVLGLAKRTTRADKLEDLV